MRFLYAVVLLVFLGAVAVFAFQNNKPMEIRFLDRSVVAPVPLVTLASYGLGMLSGWTVVGFLRSSIRRVTEEPTRNQ